eukprot:Nk52_evm74s485 gene=Nk52_evmTU74s485
MSLRGEVSGNYQRVVERDLEEIDCGTTPTYQEGIDEEEGGRQHHIYEYHVVYSASYSVPVLYFKGSRLDGTPLTLSDVLEWGVRDDLSESLASEKLYSISQKEHPMLGTPFFTIHPCNTVSLMSEIWDGGCGREIFEHHAWSISKPLSSKDGLDVDSADYEDANKPLKQQQSGFTKSANDCYVLRWLSVYGQIVGMDVDLKYFSTKDSVE